MPLFIHTPEDIARRLTGCAVPKYVAGFARLAVGRRIVAVGYLVSNPKDKYPEEWPTPALRLDDGTIITSSADDEGNGPGVLKLAQFRLACDLTGVNRSGTGDADPILRFKLFDPCGSWSWYVIGWSIKSQDVVFGYVEGFENELGDFSLQELSIQRGRMGIGIEIDNWFKPVALSVHQDKKAGRGAHAPPPILNALVAASESLAPTPEPPPLDDSDLDVFRAQLTGEVHDDEPAAEEPAPPAPAPDLDALLRDLDI